MIDSKKFVEKLFNLDVRFYTGVPDSLLKDICAYITDTLSNDEHIIAANEGNAIALAAGYYLSTGKVPLVYMQNSGFGNIVNPLTSLTSKDVYSIPALLVIGWRGEPGIKDEPQHVHQGKVTAQLLEALDIPYEVVDTDTSNVDQILERAHSWTLENKSPYAILVRKGTFEKYKQSKKVENSSELNRELAIEIIAKNLDKNDLVLSTTGHISRELYEYRINNGDHCSDFLNVGSMGHVSQIALGVALNKKNKKVICLDGDGASLMHMGGMGIVGQQSANNFKHIVLNNGAHMSVGGQPTAGFHVDFCKVADACGYSYIKSVESQNDLELTMSEFLKAPGPCFLEVKVALGARADLGRPKSTPIENKLSFMEKVNA